MITSLKDNEVFVFGSNTAGIHGAGAAKQAREQFGAALGYGEGLTGQCYAFPTLNAEMQHRTDEELKESVAKFYQTAREFPELTFLLTEVGTGLAGYTKEYMASLFKDLPKNVIPYENWI